MVSSSTMDPKAEYCHRYCPTCLYLQAIDAYYCTHCGGPFTILYSRENHGRTDTD